MDGDKGLGGRILVVDDDPVSRRVAEMTLVSEGFIVDQAVSGLDALHLLQTREIDLVILDIQMPGIDGLETCRRIRAMPSVSDLPIAFLTLQGDYVSHQRSLDAGGDDFLTKPLSRSELLNRVRSLLWMRRLRKEIKDGIELIRSQRHALLQSQRDKDELVRMVIHDLRNPLASILANVRFAASEPGIPDAAGEALGDVLPAVETMQRLIMNLMDISLAESGRLAPRIESEDLLRLLTDAATSVTPRLLQRRQQIIVSGPSEPIGVLADRDLIHRALEALVENASRHSPAGSVITLDSARLSEEFIEVRITDQSVPIEPGARDPFLMPTSEPEKPSDERFRARYDLGLVFVRLMIEAHGGHVSLEPSQASAGNVFLVALPRSPVPVV